MNLIGSPITFTVTALTENSALTYVFHRLYIKVTAGSMVMVNSTAVASGETVQFDVSSALRAAFDSHVYSVISTTQERPSISFSVSYYEKYMVDGEVTTTTESTVASSQTAYPGKFTDLERMANNSNDPGKSRKPSTGELVKKGSVYSVGGTVTAVATAGKSSDGKYWVIEDDDMYEIQFVNSMGMVESVCVKCLPEEALEDEEEEYSRSYGVGFSDINRMVLAKTRGRLEYEMTSGPVNRAWQKWFLSDFCMCSQAWIKIDGSWVPCSISADGSKGWDKTSSEVLSVEFKVMLNVEV